MKEIRHGGSETQAGGRSRPTARYWIALNGSSCALSRLPWVQPETIPVAEQLIGFWTLAAAEEVQRLCLTAPIEQVEAFLRETVPVGIAMGAIKVILPSNPEPQTRGPTVWTEKDPPTAEPEAEVI